MSQRPALGCLFEVVETLVLTVVDGESLWSIARDRVGTDAVVPYWHALCDANRTTVPSGDLNLIHPGETVVLPADL